MNKELIHQHLSKLGANNKTLWIAYSGGMDSHVLLHSLSDYPAKIQAVHIHHGLNTQADSWASHCEKVCQSLQIPLITKKIQLRSNKNIEAQAREKRYGVFSSLLQNGDFLLTAHHQDDQAETLLLQLFRGAGLKGLSAMPEKTLFGPGILLRPLLHYTRSELQEYAHLNQLTWVEDSSNQNLHFQRNFIRHELLPLIETRWPGIKKTLSRSAHHIANAQALLEDSATNNLKDILLPNQTLSISKLLQLTQTQQQNVLRFWLLQLKYPLPSYRKLLSIQKNILHCKSDAAPLVEWANAEIRRYRDQLFAIKQKEKIDTSICYEWNLKEEIKIPSHSKPLTQLDLITQGINLSDIESLTIRFRQKGERCRLKGHAHSKCLKKLFQELGVPPWERDSVPLIYHQDHLIAVWGYGITNQAPDSLAPHALLTDLKYNKTRNDNQ